MQRQSINHTKALCQINLPAHHHFQRLLAVTEIPTPTVTFIVIVVIVLFGSFIKLHPEMTTEGLDGIFAGLPGLTMEDLDDYDLDNSLPRQSHVQHNEFYNNMKTSMALQTPLVVQLSMEAIKMIKTLLGVILLLVSHHFHLPISLWILDPGEKDIFIISDGYEDWRMPKKEYRWKAWLYTEQLCAETFEHTFNPVLRHQPSQIQQRRFQA
ncbi:predicted protein [Lichtheimia corymbifera JMRC:FSU:9682]|uniref:Uncharacterized protein n=1 Tax=Lichtheimia corymbifera JMRC:FSU:9682 TaxID=1263082 RepID=A0A068SCW0_9FUNG|nr:predicted protein [Lichtheimia corymbifera JMRC:FSU:9682]